MKVEMYASSVKVGDVIYAAPTGKGSPVKLTVTHVGCTREWVIITGTRQLRGKPVEVVCSMPAFSPIKMEL